MCYLFNKYIYICMCIINIINIIKYPAIALWYTKLVELKSALIVRTSAEVQLKIYSNIFDCANVYNQGILQYALNILHLKIYIIQWSYDPLSIVIVKYILGTY